MATLIFKRVKIIDIKAKVSEPWLLCTSISMIGTRLIKTQIISVTAHFFGCLLKNPISDCSAKFTLQFVDVNSNFNFVFYKKSNFGKIFIQNLFQFPERLLPYSILKTRKLIIAEDNINKLLRLYILLARNLDNFKSTKLKACTLYTKKILT